MSAPREEAPSEVPPRAANQGGEALHELRERLGAEPEAWTKRMLASLAKGVKGGRCFSLPDKTAQPRVLRSAWERVLSRGGSGGIDGVCFKVSPQAAFSQNWSHPLFSRMKMS